MVTKCNCIDDTRGFIITGVITIIGICLYAILIGVFYLREYKKFELAVIWSLFGGDLLSILF